MFENRQYEAEIRLIKARLPQKLPVLIHTGLR
jgi:hypothetical protein